MRTCIDPGCPGSLDCVSDEPWFDRLGFDPVPERSLALRQPSNLLFSSSTVRSEATKEGGARPAMLRESSDQTSKRRFFE